MADKITIVIDAKAKDAIDALNKVKKGLQDQSTEGAKATSIFSKLTKGYAVMGAILGGAVVAGFTKATKAAIDFEETLSKFNTVFKDVQAEATKTRENLAKNFGLSSAAATKLLADTGDLLSGFGFTGKAALDLSRNVNELAVDLASFTNAQGGAEAVSQALTKALLGERESLKTYGIAILEADVQQRLFEKGQQDLTGEALRQAKAQATLELAMRQSKNAIGDFARTQDSTANLIRRVQAAFIDIATEIGGEFVPILRVALKFLLSLGKTKAEIALDNYKDAVQEAAEAQNILNKIQSKTPGDLKKIEAAALKLDAANVKVEATRRRLTAETVKFKDSLKEEEDALKKLKSEYAEGLKLAKNRINSNKETIKSEKEKLKTFQEELKKVKATQEEFSFSLDDEGQVVKKRNPRIVQLERDIKQTEKILGTFEDSVQTHSDSTVDLLDEITIKEKALADLRILNSQLNEALAVGDEKRVAQILKQIEASETLAKTNVEGSKKTQKELEAETRQRQTIQKTIEDSVLALIDIYSSLADAQIQLIENEKKAFIDGQSEKEDALKSQLDNGLISQEQYEKGVQELQNQTAAKEKELNAKIAEEKKKAFIAEKVARIAQIAMSTAAAIMNVWSTTPNPVAAGILTGIVGTLGTVQAGIAAAQPIPAFATGGSMITSGPQMFLAGDNPGGRERVEVTPLDTSTINNNTTNSDNRNISIIVQANDPITFNNRLKRQYGLDVFGA